MSAVVIALTRRTVAVIHVCISPSSTTSLLRGQMIAALARGLRTPAVVHFHGDVLAERAGRSFTRDSLFSLVMRTASAVIVLSRRSLDAVRRRYPSIGHGKVFVIPNGVEVAAWDVDRSTNGVDVVGPDGPADLHGVFVGDYVAEKGVDRLIAIAQRMDRLRLTLIGSGPDGSMESLLSAIARAGIGERVSVLGHLKPDDVRHHLNRSDVFILPSKREGFPMVVLEAMAAALPIVASNVGAIPEIVDVPQGGFVCEVDDVDGYVGALNILHNDRKLLEEMGRYNRAKVARYYSAESVIKRLCALYDAVTLQAPK